MQRMSMMLSGFGWKKASPMSVWCAHIILRLNGKVVADRSHKWIYKEPNDQEINFLFVFTFALRAGPVQGLLQTEIFPSRIRAKAMAFCMSVHWINLQLMVTCFLLSNQAYSANHILKGTQMAQSRYLFALSCFHMNLLTEAEAALCPRNDPASEVPNGAAGHYLLGLVYRFLYGDQAQFFNDEIHIDRKHSKTGTVAMASAEENMNASPFYITLRDDLDYLDGKHTVFGEVAEGFETLTRINEAYADGKGRPFKIIRIKHTYILEDPYDDPPQLPEFIPEGSPEGKPKDEVDDEVRLEDDWVPVDEQLNPGELEEVIRSMEAHSRAVVLESIGDIPDAEVKPPDNVLFVCKLNPVTEWPPDLQMDNALIDDRRIHMDCTGDATMKQSTKYILKDNNSQRGGHNARYEMVFDGDNAESPRRETKQY
ncbi:peptidyl-prolyl cis-trans isomerase CYP59-like isoform X1 [Trifolium pratense]|uniref:peptidyl-prolyl cis-trans isomerase CYP59-like isoform X1 n=1 Tax=Trifolium pratense TaxID=57577 RepID=UPI001E693185|nr:peptidyl-prolyl cis-trans isomerase CYP59-like isoform X1 [Trifolium pratense]